MANYLFRRNGRYSYRRRYPMDVAVLLKKSEFVQALGTADPKEAARLARAVSVQFDEQCDAALSKLAGRAMEAMDMAEAPQTPANDDEVAKAVLDSLPGIIRTMTLDVIAEQARNKAGWHDALSWRRNSLKAHLAGQMPAEILMHPLTAATALRALDAAAAGEPQDISAAPRYVSPSVAISGKQPEPDDDAILTQEKLERAMLEYSSDKTSRRKHVARRCADRTLKLPCTKQEATKSISEWCVSELADGKKPSSVWTEASAVIALLKFVPNWHDFHVAKNGGLRTLRGAGRARTDSRAPMQVSVLYGVLNRLPDHLPRNGDHWYASLIICALYGLRPGELLQSGPEALQVRRDIFGKERLVFRVGMDGAKNKASERDLPVSDEIKPLFEQALRKGRCGAETARTRVERLNSLVRVAQGANSDGVSLYSVRHLFADIARACDYQDSQFGPIMGHSDRGITAVYGGKAPLEGQAEILKAVQLKLFPAGLQAFWPVPMAPTSEPAHP